MDTRRVHLDPCLSIADELNGMPQKFEYRPGHDSTLLTSLNSLMIAHTTVPFDDNKADTALGIGNGEEDRVLKKRAISLTWYGHAALTKQHER
jgi:hypothetical protein